MNPLRRALSAEKAVAAVAAAGQPVFPQVGAPSVRYRYGADSGSAPVAATFVSGSALPVSATASASCYRSATAPETPPVAAEAALDQRLRRAATAATAFAQDTRRRRRTPKGEGHEYPAAH